MTKKPNVKLTVVLRDDAPNIHLGCSPAYRSVTIQLTDEQLERLALKHTHRSAGVKYFEEIAMCFLEANDD